MSPEVVCPVLISTAKVSVGSITLTPLRYKFGAVYVRGWPKKLKELVCEVDAKTVFTNVILLLIAIELVCKATALRDEVVVTCVLTKKELKIFV
jgi:hypothetical protein